ncbi:MAG: hypothetical protein JXL80_05825 [Planctomycetes bacterium]|nr:hypothetical protein [Planctomycetota bacterium]
MDILRVVASLRVSAFVLLAVVIVVAAAPPTMAADAAPGAGSAAIQVHVGDILIPDYETEPPQTAGADETVRIVAARGGTFSAKVVVSGATTIRRLAAELSDLKADSGSAKIPASAALVRYARPFGSYAVPRNGGFYNAKPGYLSLLTETPPEEVAPVTVKQRGAADRQAGPVVPVWITLAVPRDATPGRYRGRLTVRAAGSKPVTLPVEVEVIDWTVPPPSEWTTWVDLIQSPDTLAVEYGLEPWSERHWQMIACSLHFMGQVGNRIVYVPLIARSNFGNEQSMVRWVKKSGSRYDYDLGMMDRYLDTALKEMGKPQIVVFVVWENYMIRPGRAATGAAADHEQQRILDELTKANLLSGKGPLVTQLDRPGGPVREAELAHYGDPESKAQWAPLFDKLRQHLAARGLESAAMLGMINDCWPTREEVAFFKDIAPEMRWVLQAHFGRHDVYDLNTAGYRSQVWSLQQAKTTSLLGWKQPNLFARFNRSSEFGYAPLVTWRYWAEYCITGNQRGVARLGADYWLAVRDKRGTRRGPVWERYPEASWRNLGIYTSLLGPDAEGPVATTRFEMLREGVQECEARISIERALDDEAARTRLEADLVARCRRVLDERVAGIADSPGRRFGFDWKLGSDWPQRSRTLYELAGEVARKLKPGAERPRPGAGR